MNKEFKLSFLLEKSFFNLNKDEKQKMEKELESFSKELELLNEFELEDITPQMFPFISEEHNLRSDDIVINNAKNIMKDSPNKKEDYIYLEVVDK